MTLLWLRQSWNTETLAFWFGVDKATVSRNTRRVLRALEEPGMASLGWPQPPRKGEGKTLEEALEAVPDLLAIIDGMDQRIQRPQDPKQQRQHYSGRRKAHTRKVIIVVNEHGPIRAVTSSAPGSRPDWKQAVESGMVEPIPKTLPVIGEAGFDGLQNDDPDRSLATPHKAQPELASVRIVVEHTISGLKRFRILSSVFRHLLSLYDAVLRAVVGVVNFRMDRRRQKAESVASSVFPTCKGGASSLTEKIIVQEVSHLFSSAHKSLLYHGALHSALTSTSARQAATSCVARAWRSTGSQ